jgi:hypothetical protein
VRIGGGWAAVVGSDLRWWAALSAAGAVEIGEKRRKAERRGKK